MVSIFKYSGHNFFLESLRTRHVLVFLSPSSPLPPSKKKWRRRVSKETRICFLHASFIFPPFFLSFSRAGSLFPSSSSSSYPFPPPPSLFIAFRRHFPPAAEKLKKTEGKYRRRNFFPLLLLLLLVARRFGENLEGESQTKEGTAFPGTQEK